MGHERPPIRCRALVRTTLRWPIDPAKRSVGLLKCDACRRHTSCLLPRQDFGRPASKAVLKSSRFRGREEYGSASQLGQNPVVLWASTRFLLRPRQFVVHFTGRGPTPLGSFSRPSPAVGSALGSGALSIVSETQSGPALSIRTNPGQWALPRPAPLFWAITIGCPKKVIDEVILQKPGWCERRTT